MDNQKQTLDFTWETISASLDQMRMIFNLVRLVDAEECREVFITEDGQLRFGKECYAVWNADHRCANCTSYQSCHTHQKKSRTEYYNGKEYQIQSIPVQITLADEMTYSCNLELINYRELSSDEWLLHQPAKNERETGEYLTTHDTLTGLLNWSGFCKRVRKLIMDDPDRKRLLIASDIRNFKLVNNLFGRSKGDEVLIEVANILRDICDETSVYGRYVNDIFAICIPQSAFRETVFSEISSRILSLIDSPSYRPDIHFGIFEITDPNLPLSIMFDRAHMALQSVRNNHGQNIAWFDETILNTTLHEQMIISNFEQNLHSGQFVMYLQPQIDAKGELEGAECLVRWITPDGRLILPYEFISILEQSNLISMLDKYVWELAVKQLQYWKTTDLKNLYLSVNVSPRDFYYVDVFQTLSNLCSKYGVSPGKLHVEITESAIADETQDNMATIELLQKNGFTVEIDDFGKGSSSLSLLKDVKADVLKIDMGFLRQTENSKRGSVILSSIIDMAKRLGMEVISEGVETDVQLQNLTSLGCDMFQGYYFSKPIPVSTFEELAKNRVRHVF